MNEYNVVTTVDTQQPNEDGSFTTIPAGSVINTVLWDGQSNWSPPPNTILQKVVGVTSP